MVAMWYLLMAQHKLDCVKFLAGILADPSVYGKSFQARHDVIPAISLLGRLRHKVVNLGPVGTY
ncbi:hypothetical protein I79_004421 [Cricetulus griseus]|uniref:Uncharacterized protein n=1 Tax=Cricetulus griseus TaxID=10029 RepID=G3H2K6_CRIGR|nr:hypothetical protein I79_004421 [Cricetulus griseus]